MLKVLRLMIFWTVVGVIIMPALGMACSTPVFEYALQRWIADPYGVHISHGAQPDADERSAIALLQENIGTAGTGANINLSVSIATNSLSTITVSYPKITKIQTPVWKVPLTVKNAEKVVNSTVRKLMVKELVAGRCAVWLFLESGNKAQDDAAEQRLRATLLELEKTLQLPEIPDTAVDDESVSAVDDRKVSFSVIRMSRANQAETLLVRSLLGSESDLQELKEPMVFPVFGRGRMLYAMVGKGINQDLIERYSVFITGSCACEVKAQNPGMDLLLSANWEDVDVRYYHEDTPLPPLSAIAVDIVEEGIPVLRDEMSSSKAAGSIARNTIIGLAGFAVLVFGCSLAIFLSGRGSR